MCECFITGGQQNGKNNFEEMGGTYRQVGDYFIPNLVLPAEEEHKPIDIWGQLHGRFFKDHQRMLYMNSLTSGKLNKHLAELDEQAEEMSFRLVK